MKRFTLRLLKFLTDFLLLFLPRRNTGAPRTRNQAGTQPEPGWSSRGWTLREVVSERTGLCHRYYHHPAGRKNAPVFLLLHGMFLDGRNFLNVDGLAQNWTLLAYDFPETSPLYSGRMEDFDLLMDDFLSCLAIDHLFIGGVSFGGLIGQHYAAHNPERVEGLVLVSTTVSVSRPEKQSGSRDSVNALFAYEEARMEGLLAFVRRLALGRSGSPLRDIAPIWRIKKPEWYRQGMLAMVSADFGDRYHQITCPVLVIHGDRDSVFPVSRIRKIHKYLPQAEVRIFKRGSHVLSYTRGDEVADCIREFFETP